MKRLIAFAKIAVAIGLIVWLTLTGTIDWDMTLRFFTSPQYFLTVVTILCAVNFILLPIRLRIAAKVFKADLNQSTAVRATLLGNCAGQILPGVLWGDVLKVSIVSRAEPGRGVKKGSLIVLGDRFAGLMGLVVLGVCAVFFWPPEMWNQVVEAASGFKSYGAWVGAVGVLVGLVLVVFIGLWSLRNYGRDLLGTIRKIYGSNRKELIALIGLGTLTQLGFFSAVAICSVWYTSGTIPLTDVFSIFPVDAAIGLLPLSPGGVGVKHVSFEFFLNILGHAGGANIMNAYLITKLLTDVTCGIPAILYSRSTQQVLVPQV